jgi:hypothetical protein
MTDLLGATMPPLTEKRESLVQLRPRHLNLIEILADTPHLSIEQLQHQSSNIAIIFLVSCAIQKYRPIFS